MPLPSIGENAVNGILYHRHFLLTPLNVPNDMLKKDCCYLNLDVVITNYLFIPVDT